MAAGDQGQGPTSSKARFWLSKWKPTVQLEAPRLAPCRPLHRPPICPNDLFASRTCAQVCVDWGPASVCCGERHREGTIASVSERVRTFERQLRRDNDAERQALDSGGARAGISQSALACGHLREA